MARISTYDLDSKVTDGDKWIGTDSGSFNKTKNFTPIRLAEYFNSSEKIDSTNSLRFYYQIPEFEEERAVGTISFESFLGLSIPLSDLSYILLSKTTEGGIEVPDFLASLIDSKVLLHKGDSMNVYGIYEITSIEDYEINSNFFKISFSFIRGNGNLANGSSYLLSVIDFGLEQDITKHSELTLDDGTNPHGTTKSDLDLENVPNIDATNRANHTGTQLSTTISDLQETIEDTIGTKVKAGANVSISYDDTTGETTISSTDNGEVNTASNIGTAGVGVFKQKTGANLEFKKINSGSNKVIITDDVVNNEVDINVVEANFTGIPQSAVTNLTTDISNKLDKSSTPSSVYATDAGGLQVMKPISEFQTDISGKLDKVSTSGVERVYTINTDGSQGTKPTSDFKDVLEFADFASFPATGESGKIYVALDIDSAYYFIGSAYVQIGGNEYLKKDISTYTQATTPLSGTEKVLIHDGTDFKEVAVSEFIYTTDGKSYESLSSAMAVVPLPENNTIFYIDDSNLTERGVYAYDSNEVNGYRFIRDYNTPNGVVEQGNTQAVSGGEVYNETKKIVYKSDLMDNINLFDKLNVINGYYIDTTTGGLEAFGNSSISDWISIKGGSVYFLSGRNTTVNNIRFKDSSGNILKPIDENGDEYTNFNIGYQNGIIYTPLNAISVQLQAVFNNIGNTNRIQLESGNKQTLYKPFGVGIIKDEFLNNQGIEVSILENDLIIRSDFNGVDNDISINFNKSISPNKLFNLNRAYLIGKNSKSDDFENGLQLNGASDEENAPIHVNGTYIGANHGALAPLEVNVSSHNKTLADVGSTWLDDSNQVFILLRILSSTKLLVCSTNRNGVGEPWDFKTGIDAKLTYQSNGVNTSIITPLSTNRVQLYPSVKNIVQKYFIDGKEVKEDVVLSDKFILSESYDIVDVPSMLSNLVSNRPSGGYTTQPSLTDGDTLATITNNNIIVKGCGVANYYTFTLKKEAFLNYYGATQSEFLKPSWAEEIYRMYPNSLPINGYDFRRPVEISGSYTSEMNLTSEYWEDPNFPVIRSVDTLNGVRSVNFNIGYLPILSQENRKEEVNNAWYLYTSKKQYPHASDTKIGTLLPAGTFRSGVAFRNWTERKPERWNKFYVENENETYLFVDYIDNGFDRIELPSNLVGKMASVIYATSNVKLLTNIAGSYIDINVSSGTYGNIIIRFK